MLRRHTRLSLPHSLHFITAVTSARGQWFVDTGICRNLLGEFERARDELGLMCVAYVLMPDHVHALLMQDPGFDVSGTGQVKTPAAEEEKTHATGGELGHVRTHAAGAAGERYALPIAEFMRRFKRRTSTRFRPRDYPVNATLWHRRYDDVGVGSAHAFWTRVKYIHDNPAKKGLSDTPEGYPWSSARAFLTREQGIVRVELDLIGPWIK